MDLLATLRSLLSDLRQAVKEEHRRHVSVQRFAGRASRSPRAAMAFSEGASCLDNMLILGATSVGRSSSIRPNVIFDGTGGLSIAR